MIGAALGTKSGKETTTIVNWGNHFTTPMIRWAGRAIWAFLLQHKLSYDCLLQLNFTYLHCNGIFTSETMLNGVHVGHCTTAVL